MGEIKNLYPVEGIKKLKELARDEICFFCTFEDDCRITTRPMSTQDIDDEGNLWFFSHYDSDKNMQIEDINIVQLLYSNPDKQKYLSISGEATILRDRNKTSEIWTPLAKAWFIEGKDDPSLTLIKVKPTQAYYWDAKDGRMTIFLKTIAGVVTGNFEL